MVSVMAGRQSPFILLSLSVYCSKISARKVYRHFFGSLSLWKSYYIAVKNSVLRRALPAVKRLGPIFIVFYITINCKKILYHGLFLRMEEKPAKPKAENDFDIKSFIVESSEAKRIFALNSREEKRLQRERKNLEKQRVAEEKRLVKAQKDAVTHFVHSRRRISAVKVDVYRELKATEANTVSQPCMSSPEIMSLSSGKRDSQSFMTEKYKGKHSRKVGSVRNHIASNSVSVFPDMQRILASEGNLIQRSRSWSDQWRPRNFRSQKESERNKMTGKLTQHLAEKSLTHKDSTGAVKSKTERKETSLCDVLPPVVLPPLHSQENKLLRKKTLRRNLNKWAQNEKEKLWNGLDNCRYLRTYSKKK